jgi:opacity protein-like surface antigen
MKKILLASLFAVAASSAYAGVAIDFYAGAEGSFGRSIAYVPETAFTGPSYDIKKSANGYGAFLGIDIPLVRVEAEYNYVKSNDIDLHIGMLNGYFKFLPTPIMKPYVGAGVGTVFGGSVGDDVDASTSPAFQGMVGVQFDVPAAPIFIDVEGRVLYANGIYEIPTTDKEIGFLQYDLRAKLRYMF